MRIGKLNTLSILGCFCAVALYGSMASATTVLTEDFNYPDGPLNDGNPAWVNHSGTADTLLVSGGAAAVTQNNGSEDLHRVFDAAASFTSGVVSASFDMVVTAPGAMTGTDFEYFAHFWQSTATTAFRSRTDIVAPGTAGGDYSIGIATMASTAEVTLGDLVGFNFGATVPVTITFDIDNGTSSLTAGGQTINTAVISLGQNIDGFGMRQSDSSSDETIFIDNLVVTHVPEPASVSLLLGCLGVLAMRRR